MPESQDVISSKLRENNCQPQFLYPRITFIQVWETVKLFLLTSIKDVILRNLILCYEKRFFFIIENDITKNTYSLKP